ncbi:MAG: nucleotidyltransferase family protein [Patescibacteria group bacterium]|jgi:NDP-sugar pyrophosphorylase family protein|nr:nucleotidyltransferase family protein [Patescibacteria group bacterium]
MDRSRLTITLKKDILRPLDDYIDGSRIRNRSHAIEYVLSKYFAPKIKKAVILAGGKGQKMRPFTYEMPKAMILVNGRPVLQHIIENLRRYDVREIIISVGHKGNKIKQYFGDGSRLGVKISYLDQGKLETGTAAPIIQAEKLIGQSPFIVYYGDVLANIDLDDMIDFHLSTSGLVTMALASVNKSFDWGVVRLQGTKVYSYLEKPDQRRDLSNIINAGIYIFEPQIFDYLKGASRLEKDVLPKLVEKRKLYGYMFAGQWFDVGNPEIYKQAVKEWKN